jgi:F-type H+-transporting ATPase subunit gamma
MASGKEIRAKIASIKSTQKITRATEMIAASKIRQAQLLRASSDPYTQHIQDVVGHLAKSHPEYVHPFMQHREIKRCGYIIVSTDKGLCGGLNANLFRALVKEFVALEQRGQTLCLSLIGRKAKAFFPRFTRNISAAVDHLGDKPRAADLSGVITVMLDAYLNGEIDALFLGYNKFINTMSQRPLIEPLLPIPPMPEPRLDHHWDYLYEPDARDILDVLLRRYVSAKVYQAVVENLACEQAAKMLAMRNATENAGDLIAELQVSYNKARQATITTELTEIVAGAAAV